MAVDAKLVEKLDEQLRADLDKDGRLGLVRRYLRGDHNLPYMPKKAKKEFAHLAKVAITNWTPLVSDTYAKGLFVDGYRAAKTRDNAGPWTYWQENGLDARQAIAHRGAIEYGTSYALILPGQAGARRTPYFRPLSPLKSAAWYRDDDDEFPEIAFRRRGETIDGTQLVELFDNTNRYTYAKPKEGNWTQSRVDAHGLGVTPFVRFRDRLDDEATGVIRPILNLQDRVNEIVFSTLIAIQYASFRQRWATGLAIPEDEETGEPVEPFEAAVNRLWVAEDAEARFGDFAQTELSGHHSAYDSGVKTLAAISQVSPNIMTGDLVNVNAETLAQMQDTTQRKLGEYETLFGEAWESGFRLAARAAGDSAGAADTSAEVRWRDTEARALAATVDALGKMATMLSVPVEALWEQIPGITDGDIARWRDLRDTTDPIAELAAEFDRQTAASTESASGDTDGVKAQADALGSLIRAGVEPSSAASKVGLTGVTFTGAVPVSLRLPQTDASELEQT
ncbi:phage portal protein [Herbiconiux moechotypicola]|uniref:Portal protein n=1 Tax=Herbiconiux moechotypicola TaxID=637393 RepID=A0ABP5QAE0_9MICO|nr:phage portal protein [Herbiconiux moechotypicola]MCS5729483.1 phage portal protein [Herbiconiux moechotypicola]